MEKENNDEKLIEDTSISFPIVGIGASAGGLEAFKEFFSGMPDNNEPGMAFVLIQHLAPDHKSSLRDIIQRCTDMEVLEVEDGMKVQCNKVYIIPPSFSMTFSGGILRLNEPSAPRGQRMLIDDFFRSLAQDQGKRSIGVILSGTGSDGTLGVRAIKGEGGLVMVQEPASAKYDSMPRHALDTGLVDYELPSIEMLEQLIGYVSHEFSTRSSIVTESSGKEEMLEEIFKLLLNHTGHDFSQYKNTTIYRRIQHRMSVQQIKTIDRYVKYLQQASEEVENLYRDLLIGVTSFFREPAAFNVLKKEVIPKVFSNNWKSGVLRLWVPGCSTGEEAYTIAILIAEYQKQLNKSFKIQIFATDINSNAISIARKGIFPASITRDISSERLSCFFKTSDNGKTYRIQNNIREMLIFSEHNIIEDPPFSRLDLISCRNLLIYMKRDLQKKIISLFRYALNSNGFLFLGSSETLGESGDFFTSVNNKWKIYQLKKNIQKVPKVSDNEVLSPLTEKEIKKKSPVAATLEVDEKLTLRELTEQKILEQFAPAAVLVNIHGQVLYIHGHTGSYLELSPGKSGVNNILKMARGGLQSELTTALNQASKNREKIFCPNINVKNDDESTKINLIVSPVKNKIGSSKYDEFLFLVVFEEIFPSEKGITEKDYDFSTNSELENSSGEDPQVIITKLQQKLQAKEESLQNTIEELQTANEELKSSNEELQSVNEELQSTNEELETSKEELQSVNEELKTVNAELENKVEELKQANTDMNNLLSGTGIGTVFVDLELHILRFTSAATEFINLIESDIGRPVSHIASNLKNYKNLAEDLQEVLDTLVPKEIEVQNEDDKWYLMRIQPYRTEENVIKGAVITFKNINEKKQIQNELGEVSKLIVEQMVTVINEPLLVLDTDLRIIAANSAFYDFFQEIPEEIQGKLLFKINNNQWDIPALRKLLTEVREKTKVVHNYQFTHEFERIGKCSIRFNARRILSDSHSCELILLVLEKIIGFDQNSGDTDVKKISNNNENGDKE
ncbi:MAG: chemotaxis protein CheB [Bacillota bacterium]